MYVIKASGEFEKFDSNKIKRTRDGKAVFYEAI